MSGQSPPGATKRCRSCKALIVWTKTEKGKPMPCDLEPASNGKFFLFRRPDRIEAISTRSSHGSVAVALQRGDKTYTSHFATCPFAGQHRKPR